MIARSRAVAPVFFALFACAPLACSSSSPSAGASPESCAPASVSFASDVLPTFAANCTTGTICHGQTGDPLVENLYLGAMAGGSSADGDMVFAGLVNVRSLEAPAVSLVSPGSLAKSYLWHKVIGDQNTDPTTLSSCQAVVSGPNPCSDCLPQAPCGVQMPFGASVLDAASACIIQNWIANGATKD